MTEDQKTQMFVIFVEHVSGLMNEAAEALEGSDVTASEAFRKVALMMGTEPGGTIH
jgi:hypothetical protein